MSTDLTTAEIEELDECLARHDAKGLDPETADIIRRILVDRAAALAPWVAQRETEAWDQGFTEAVTRMNPEVAEPLRLLYVLEHTASDNPFRADRIAPTTEEQRVRSAVRTALQSVVDAADDKHYARTRANGDAHLAHGDCETCGLIADLNAILQRETVTRAPTTERTTR